MKSDQWLAIEVAVFVTVSSSQAREILNVGLTMNK
jgi:hypothetical protein